MSRDWQTVRLSDIARPVRRPVALESSISYRTIGVKWWGEGAYERQTIDGSQTAAKTLSIVREGDLIINKIWVRHGSTAIATKAVDGCAASGEFPTFELDLARILPRWLHWLTKTKLFWSKCEMLSRGTSGKNRIKPELFLTIEIPLPPLEEQRRIVARIEELAVKIEEARGLRKEIAERDFLRVSEGLFSKVFQSMSLFQDSQDEPASVLLNKIKAAKIKRANEKKIKQEEPPGLIQPNEFPYEIPKHWVWVRLGNLCSGITDGTHQTPRYIEEGMMFLSAQNVKPYRFMPKGHKRISYEDYLNYTARVKPEKGDILITRVGAGIGEAAVIDQELDFAIYVSLGLIKPLREYVYAPYLVHWLNSPYGTAQSRQHTLGRGNSQGNLNLNLLRQFVVPFPPPA